MNQQEVSNLIRAIQENQFSLGLSWSLRPGTIVSTSPSAGTFVQLDGSDSDDEPNYAIPLGAQLGQGLRCMCLLTSPTSVYIIGAEPAIGSPVLRVRRAALQSAADGANTFIQWDTVDLDIFNIMDPSTPTSQILLPVPGWYLMSGRAVFAANATSRRAFFINKNATTSGTGTIGGQSLQAPATGTAQVHAIGLGYMNGTDDTIGGRVVQNSGGALNLDTTDGGSVLEMTYLGGPIQ